MVKISDFTFASSNGANDIHGRLWIPGGPIRGVVQLVHGVAEHIGRYHDFASYLADCGYVTAGDDHLGHGLSIRDETELGWFGEEDGWTHLVQDEKHLHDLLASRYPGVPAVLCGHSMGSFIARTYLGWYPADFDACVLSGTGHQPGIVCRAGMALASREIKVNGSKSRSKALQKLAFGGYLKRIKNPIGENDWICRDEAVIRKYDADPLCGFTATAGLMRDMLHGLYIISRRSHLEKMDKDKPILFLAGEDDPVGNYGKGVNKTASRFRQSGMKDVTVKLYPGARHEVLNELEKETTWADALAWMTEKVQQNTAAV